MRISDWSSDVCSSDLEGALKHPGDDLHVTVRMGLEAHPGRHHAVVADEQAAVVGVVGVVVLAEGEGVLRVQPTDAGLDSVVSTPTVALGVEDAVPASPREHQGAERFRFGEPSCREKGGKYM